MTKLKYKLNQLANNYASRMSRFMYGRYGNDELNRFLIYFSIALVVINLLFHSGLVTITVLVLILITYLRSFSRNISARRRENELFNKYFGKAKPFFRLQLRRIREYRAARFRKCPHCKKILRLPVRKGKHTVCCPNCRKEFETRILI